MSWVFNGNSSHFKLIPRASLWFMLPGSYDASVVHLPWATCGILLYKVQKKDASYDSVVLSRKNVIYSGCTHSYVGPAEKYTFNITIYAF